MVSSSIIIIMKRISRVPIYCTRWQHRARWTCYLQFKKQKRILAELKKYWKCCKSQGACTPENRAIQKWSIILLLLFKGQGACTPENRAIQKWSIILLLLFKGQGACTPENRAIQKWSIILLLLFYNNTNNTLTHTRMHMHNLNRGIGTAVKKFRNIYWTGASQRHS